MLARVLACNIILRREENLLEDKVEDSETERGDGVKGDGVWELEMREPAYIVLSGAESAIYFELVREATQDQRQSLWLARPYTRMVI